MQTVNEINNTSDPLLFANDGAANTPALAEYHGELQDVVDNTVKHDFMTLADGVNMLLQDPTDIIHPPEDAVSFDPEILDSLRNENFEKELSDQRVFANDGATNIPALAEYHGELLDVVYNTAELDFMTLADGVNMLLQNPDDIVHPPEDATNFEIKDTTIGEDLDVNTTNGKVGKQWYTSKSRQWNKFSHLEEAIYTICEDKIHAKFDEIPLDIQLIDVLGCKPREDPKCDGFLMLQLSQISRNPDRKYLKCQYGNCQSGLKWLDEAILDVKNDSTNGYHKCGDTSHWKIQCPWNNCVCNNKMCGGERSLKTTQNGLNTRRKYLKCSLCLSFEWLSNAMREARQKTEKFDPTVTIKMALSDNFTKMSLK
ncbi:hypothetical protein IFM89_019017 [Coptis chinensis]|uniref:Uncharacterized protein n=1 Tax=Coptis chinensis TaxID=261450 RepID=A0A835LJU0_9MAGN|nr:hypothetical protein IFM89_019017 [Coptis chinensis]